MELFFELVDQEEVLHKRFRSNFEDLSTLDQMCDRIKSVWGIPSEFQKLFLGNGSEIFGPGDNSLISYGLKDGDKVIVKHSLLDLWEAYLRHGKSATDKKNPEEARKEFANQAIDYSKRLRTSGFFRAYTKFEENWNESYGELMRFVDRTREAFEKIAEVFFTQMYPGAQISFKPKPGGTRAGIVVVVKHNNEETTFFMKSYHNAGSSLKNKNPDLREMLSYRIFELIGVGPVVFFPFYEGSTFYHFIATKEVDAFTELDKIEDSHLLSLILGIRDLHEGNIGSNGNKLLTIVDFYVPDTNLFERPKIFDEFKHANHFDIIGKAYEVLSKINPDERIRIGKEALTRWNRMSLLTTDIIGIEKKQLGKEFGNKMKEVEEYLGEIKSNYEKICLALQ